MACWTIHSLQMIFLWKPLYFVGGFPASHVWLPEGKSHQHLIKPSFSYGFPMVFLRFSYGFPKVFHNSNHFSQTLAPTMRHHPWISNNAEPPVPWLRVARVARALGLWPMKARGFQRSYGWAIFIWMCWKKMCHEIVNLFLERCEPYVIICNYGIFTSKTGQLTSIMEHLGSSWDFWPRTTCW